jgi:N-acetylmuramoyl-L-alanine amidase
VILVAALLAAAAMPPAPPIERHHIDMDAKRRREMRAYSKRHYGYASARLRPRVIVEHIAVAGSWRAVYNTFAPDVPDSEFGELPGLCSHYVISETGKVIELVPPRLRCRHTVGLNHVAIGIEHVGFSDQDILGRSAQLNASLQLTQWLRCRFGLPVDQVIGHNESLSSPFYKELDPRFRGQTHGDWNHADMETYRGDLAKLGAC